MTSNIVPDPTKQNQDFQKEALNSQRRIDPNLVANLKILSQEFRRSAFEVILSAQSGHLGACSSSSELLTTLYFSGLMRYDANQPDHDDRDRVILRGHLGPLRYSIFSQLGWIDQKELSNYRKLGSRLQGHENMHEVPGVDITPSGSLGMVLSYGVGSAIAAKAMKKDFKVFVFLGDGEEQEGNVAEAARHASSLGLTNLICVLDMNAAQLGRRTNTVDDCTDIEKLWASYGWNVIVLEDGHDVEEIYNAYVTAVVVPTSSPCIIIAKTIKGKGLLEAQSHICGYHTISSCPTIYLENAIAELKGQSDKFFQMGVNTEVLTKSMTAAFILRGQSIRFEPTAVTTSIKIPIDMNNLLVAQQNYFSALREALLNNNLPFKRVYVLCADLIRIDEIEECGFSDPIQYIDVGIREQHMFAAAHGLVTTDPHCLVIINSSDAFAYRAADQFHAIAQGNSKVVVISDDAGVSGGKNGSTHQSVGQPGLVYTMPGVRFFEPADADDFSQIMDYAIFSCNDPAYIRLHTAKVKTIKSPYKKPGFVPSYIAYEPQNGSPDITIVASGLPVFGAIDAAAGILSNSNISARVINVIDIKSLSREFTEQLVAGRPVLTIYNGSERILRSAVSSTILAFEGRHPSRVVGHGFELGTSASVDDLIAHFRFDAQGISDVVKQNWPELFN